MNMIDTRGKIINSAIAIFAEKGNMAQQWKRLLQKQA
jgi:hypothetical protein